jgi:tetratricopeptide (TPR) repeat protein
MEHLDLLHGARRLWKLRFESCRLMDLENQVLGIERDGDVPGALIPYLYFEYLHTHQAARMLPVFHHNAFDIVTLACLTGIVPYAFKDAHGMASDTAGFQHGAEIAGIARWLREAGELEQARTLFRRAIEKGLPDALLFKILWDVAQLERKLGAEDAAIAVWTDLSAARNPFRVRALEELAKHYEHRAKNLSMALEMTRAALVHEDTSELRKREVRLAKRLSTAKPRRFL